jgi:hypothetical protein
LHQVTLWLAGAVAVLGGIYYFFVHRHMKAGPSTDRPESHPDDQSRT